MPRHFPSRGKWLWPTLQRARGGPRIHGSDSTPQAWDRRCLLGHRGHAQPKWGPWHLPSHHCHRSPDVDSLAWAPAHEVTWPRSSQKGETVRGNGCHGECVVVTASRNRRDGSLHQGLQKAGTAASSFFSPVSPSATSLFIFFPKASCRYRYMLPCYSPPPLTLLNGLEV